MGTAESDNLQDLVARAQDRDEAALTALLDTYSERLLESVRSELGDRVRQRLESQDVMQQVYLDALTSIDRFVDRGSDSFFHWLRRIAVNRICDVDRKSFRTAKRGKEVRVSDIGHEASIVRLLDDLAGSATSPSMVVDRSDHIRMLQYALDQLSEDHREVIRLRYMNQLNVSETAAKMDRSERAVRSLCVRALIHLRELLVDVI